MSEQPALILVLLRFVARFLPHNVDIFGDGECCKM